MAFLINEAVLLTFKIITYCTVGGGHIVWYSQTLDHYCPLYTMINFLTRCLRWLPHTEE